MGFKRKQKRLLCFTTRAAMPSFMQILNTSPKQVLIMSYNIYIYIYFLYNSVIDNLRTTILNTSYVCLKFFKISA